MHELLLFGQVPFAQHDQVLKILAGIAAMQPRIVTERHLIYKPRNRVTNGNRANIKPGTPVSQRQALQAQMQGDVFYLQLVDNMSSESPAGSTGKSEADLMDGVLPENGSNAAISELIETTKNTTSSEHTTDHSKHQWSIEFRDIPEVPGRRPVTSRLMASVPVADGDPFNVMDSLGYTYVSEYLLQGHRLVHNNIVLFLQRPFLIPANSSVESANDPAPGPAPVKQLPSSGDLKPLDRSGTFVLQASIRVQDGTKPESMTFAMAELTSFRDVMRGIVDMEVGDRLALDTRYR